MVVTLLDIAVHVLESEVGHNTAIVTRSVDIDSQRIIVRHRRDDFRQLLGIDANNNFVGFAMIELKILSVQFHVYQNSMRIVEIDYFESVFSESDGGVGQGFL